MQNEVMDHLDLKRIDAYLRELAQSAADVVVPPAAVGITVISDGEPTTYLASGELAEQIDELQYGAGEGPCLNSISTGRRNEVPDIRRETRWPDWVSHSMPYGVESVLATPFTIASTISGCLNLYGFAPNVFTEPEVRRVDIFAAQMSTAFTLMRDLGDAEAALTSRAVIDQAIGVLMAQQRCSSEEALVLLRQHSNNSNRKVRDVAMSIVCAVGGPPAGGPGFVARPLDA